MPGANESLVDICPEDCISRVRFSKLWSNQLLVSSWDKVVSLYDGNNAKLQYKHTTVGAQLDACFLSNDSKVVSVGLDRQVNIYDSQGLAPLGRVGEHEDTIKCVESYGSDVIVTGSWDKTVRIWDPRNGPQNSCVNVLKQPERVYSMSVGGDKLVVGTAGRHVWIYDLRNQGKILQKRESSLSSQTRDIICFPDGNGYAHTSIEGRVAIEYFGPKSQEKRFAFKCHRSKLNDGSVTAFPVNTCAFHPRYGTMATGGSDAKVYTWDPIAKKRISQITLQKQGISSLSFNHDGTLLAIAASYTFESGVRDKEFNSLCIKQVDDLDCRSKQQKL